MFEPGNFTPSRPIKTPTVIKVVTIILKCQGSGVTQSWHCVPRLHTLLQNPLRRILRKFLRHIRDDCIDTPRVCARAILCSTFARALYALAFYLFTQYLTFGPGLNHSRTLYRRSLRSLALVCRAAFVCRHTRSFYPFFSLDALPRLSTAPEARSLSNSLRTAYRLI